MKVDNSAIAFHDHIAGAWAAEYLQSARLTQRRILLEQLLLRLSARNQMWLDAGCGSGVLSEVLINAENKVIGIDGSEEMIRQAQANPKQSVTAEFRTTDTIEKLDFLPATFDGVLCSSVIEYLADPEACLHELCRVLRPGGHLIVSVPNRYSLLRISRRLAFSFTQRFKVPAAAYMRHSVNSFSLSRFHRKLECIGFEVIDCIPFGGWTPALLGARPLWSPLSFFLAKKSRVL